MSAWQRQLQSSIGDKLHSCHTHLKSSLLHNAPESTKAVISVELLSAYLIVIHVVCSIIDAAGHKLVWVQAALAKG